MSEREADEPVTALQAGNRLYAQKRYQEAVEHFVQHAREVPGEAATALANAGKCCRHINTLKQPLEVTPGATLVHEGDRAGAERFYRLALEADPSHFAALRGLADVLPPRSPERREVLERAAAEQADLVALVDLGDYYRSVVKHLERAYATYRRAQDAHPRDQTAYLRLNDICRRLGRPDEANEWSARWREVSRTGDTRRRGRAG